MDPSIQLAVAGVIAIIFGGLLLSDAVGGESESEPTPVQLEALRLHESPPAKFVHVDAVAVHHGYGFEIRETIDGEEFSSYYAPVISQESADALGPLVPGEPLRDVRLLRSGGRPDPNSSMIERLPNGLQGQLYKGLRTAGQNSMLAKYWEMFPDSSITSVWVLRPASSMPTRSLLTPLAVLLGGILALVGGIVWTRRSA